jgi:hypothetical protein
MVYQGEWTGIKAVLYDLSDGSVRLEQWIDEDSNNHWHRVLRYTDVGKWGGGFPNCGGSDTHFRIPCLPCPHLCQCLLFEIFLSCTNQ